jgi:hypothetical protein
MTTATNPTPNGTQASARQLGELGNQAYLSLVDGFLRGNERNIRFAQTVLAQADVMQRQLRRAVEEATEQTRTIQDASRTLTTEFVDASTRMLEAGRTIAQAFNGVLYEAVQASAEIGQVAVNDARAADFEARAKVNQTVARSRTATEIVRKEAEEQTGNGARK